MKKKIKKKKARDEVMLNHLLKTFNCGFHKSKKDKIKITKWEEEY